MFSRWQLSVPVVSGLLCGAAQLERSGSLCLPNGTMTPEFETWGQCFTITGDARSVDGTKIAKQPSTDRCADDDATSDHRLAQFRAAAQTTAGRGANLTRSSTAANRTRSSANLTNCNASS
jgi:hypothetical protein